MRCVYFQLVCGIFCTTWLNLKWAKHFKRKFRIAEKIFLLFQYFPVQPTEKMIGLTVRYNDNS